MGPEDDGGLVCAPMLLLYAPTGVCAHGVLLVLRSRMRPYAPTLCSCWRVCTCADMRAHRVPTLRAILLRGTDIAYGHSLSGTGLLYAPTRCPVLTRRTSLSTTRVRARIKGFYRRPSTACAPFVPGTRVLRLISPKRSGLCAALGYRATRVCGTRLGYAATALYGECGTELRYAATAYYGFRTEVGVWYYGFGTESLVLRKGMRVPGMFDRASPHLKLTSDNVH
eukprot:517476-Rhodomonas_salina.1